MPTRQPSKTKEGKEPAKNTDYPRIDWTWNSYARILDLLEILENSDELQQTIWARRGDPAYERTKADAYREIATKLLEKLPQYTAYIATDQGRIHYGHTVKARIGNLKEQFVTVKERLGAIGAGLPIEEAIWAGSELMNDWEVVKKTCPYWYRLRDLISPRTSVCDHAITNSQTNMDPSIFMTRKRAQKVGEIFGEKEKTPDPDPKPSTVPPRTVLPDRSGSAFKLKSVFTPALKLDFVSAAKPGSLQYITSLSDEDADADVVEQSVFAQPASVQPVSVQPASIRSAQPLNNPACMMAKGTKRKTAIGELGEVSSTIAEQAEKRRRLRDKEIEETKRLLDEGATERLRSKQNHEMKLRQMELEEKKSERQYKLEMKKLELLQQGISLPGNDDLCQ